MLMLMLSLSINTVIRSVLPKNAKSLILVTLPGITMPMVVTSLPITKSVRLVHRKNTESPMVVTLSGIAISVRPEQLSNASKLIVVTLAGGGGELATPFSRFRRSYHIVLLLGPL